MSTVIKNGCLLPYRIELCGGWIDQPAISSLHPGKCITLNILRTQSFKERAGLATSTRKIAYKLWGNKYPKKFTKEEIARILFAVDNPVGTPPEEVSGAEDSIGLIYPGVCMQTYEGEYWPSHITFKRDKDTVAWLERVIHLYALPLRAADYDVYANKNLQTKYVQKIAISSIECWEAIRDKDVDMLGHALLSCYNAQIAMFPSMQASPARLVGETYIHQGATGWKYTGAGGGGYLIVVGDIEDEDLIDIKINR